MVLVRSMAFHSLCEHHLLPFREAWRTWGTCPADCLVGLSKRPGPVDHFARGLQVQGDSRDNRQTTCQEKAETQGLSGV